MHSWRTAAGTPNRAAVAELIGRTGPDVVSLVEVDEPWGNPATLAGIADELGYRWTFVPAFEYRAEGGFGNALLSRTAFLAVHQWQLLSPRLYDGSEPSEPRAAVLAQVHGDGGPIWVGSTHLPRRDPALRAEASARLLGLLERLDGRWAICGDFNQPPDAWLPDHRSFAPLPPLPTYPTVAPVECIDYCVVVGAAAEARPLASVASDHLPLLIDISGPVAVEKT